jgi:hypothetical protein
VKNNIISAESLYTKLTAMYYNYVSDHEIEPFTISYGRGNGFCITANSHVGVIIHEDIVLCIDSMVTDLTLGKILYLRFQAEDVENASKNKQVLAENLNDTDKISAVDYFVVSLVNVVEDIRQNGLLTELTTSKETTDRIVGKLDLAQQIAKHPAYDAFCVEKNVVSTDIMINRIIKTALLKAKEVTELSWMGQMIKNAEDYFSDVIPSAGGNEQLQRFLAMTVSLLRDLLFVKSGLPDQVFNIDALPQLRQIAAKWEAGRLHRAADAARESEAAAIRRANTKSVLDNVTFKINACCEGRV